MRWFGPLCGSSIMSKNGRDGIRLIRNLDLGHMLQNKKMFGRGLGKGLKKVLGSI